MSLHSILLSYHIWITSGAHGMDFFMPAQAPESGRILQPSASAAADEPFSQFDGNGLCCRAPRMLWRKFRQRREATADSCLPRQNQVTQYRKVRVKPLRSFAIGITTLVSSRTLGVRTQRVLKTAAAV